ncbi:hypothetical protein SLEP1_g51383 [Rubroshorea leprosula]|uniref:UBC core domain-containing protein n=1 Tax=Rubroshorea leprosula TaxID=152421 RepID=A0AAV5M5H8_9ROSI|nr:hypothetical protein SLEP1_g51383 [Rubroshorea leprosula]
MLLNRSSGSERHRFGHCDDWEKVVDQSPKKTAATDTSNKKGGIKSGVDDSEGLLPAPRSVNPPASFKRQVTDNLQRWVIEVNGAPGTLYANETYQLQVDFPENYPMESPQVGRNLEVRVNLQGSCSTSTKRDNIAMSSIGSVTERPFEFLKDKV